MTLTATTEPTPYGLMTIISSGRTVHVAAFDQPIDGLRAKLPSHLRAVEVRDDDSDAAAALRAYLAGDVDALDSVTVEQPGGEYHSAVWRVMRMIPPGTTVSYAELAARAGAPRAVRAAASACARNAACLFVPCHRVVRSDGTLGGYFYGLDTKRRLLEHESRHRGATAGPQVTTSA